MNTPNLLLITTDQHNAEILGCAGNPVVRTPNLDKLAARGVLFTSAFTPHPLCTPARTSIFTGQYASRHGVSYNINISEHQLDPPQRAGLSADASAFPEILARSGYATALFGKLHTKQAGTKNFGLQEMRLAEGKGHFIEPGSPPDDYRCYLAEKGYPESAWRTWEMPEYSRNGWVTSPLPEEDYIDTWTATEAVRWIRQVDEPFFAWVSFSGPHTPWDPPRPYDSLYDPAAIPFPARRQGELEEKHPRWVDCLARTIAACPPTSGDPDLEPGIERAYCRFSEDHTRSMLAAYYGQITLLDAQIGRVLACLEASGRLENTMIIFTSDHGDYLGNNWAFYKYGVPYDSLSRLPFILSWPARVESGKRCDALISLIDLAPTFLQAAGVTPTDPVDGVALQPLLEGRDDHWRKDLFVGDGNVRALITLEWRYIRWSDGFEELYHRQDDPHDLHNLAIAGGHRSVCRRLRQRLARVGSTV